ncbi:MAG: alpha/beta hydrolase [Putridiphycobacter sp.]|nr:alpha/beta hydrolase [Putridiphycobacter sp.]
MKLSVTYYIILFVLKLKGIKKSFSQDPIDYKKIRKEDVHYPKGRFFKRIHTEQFNVSESVITEVKYTENSDKLLIFIHGGAFVSGPTQHHWDVLKKIATHSSFVIWMVDYPKAPEKDIVEISENIDLIYTTATKQFQSTNISMIGDSVGGTLITSLIQRLIQKEFKLPKQIILVTPVMDASMTNSEIDKVEKIDPMLSKYGVLSAKKMCAGNTDLKATIMSPLYGNFEGFPRTILFLAHHDIMYPDAKLAEAKMRHANVNIEVIEGINMPHIWPFLPVMDEAKIALTQIINILNK